VFHFWTLCIINIQSFFPKKLLKRNFTKKKVEKGPVRREIRLPQWMKVQHGGGESFAKIKQLTRGSKLNTICVSGKCPNIGECWSAGHATFMILGDICTRSCRFCGTLTGRPLPPDPEEPAQLAESVKILGLRHCVITSVDRDDLPDKGASFWATSIRKVKELNHGITIESLIPDFDGRTEYLDMILAEGPEIISHNLETVKRLTPLVRSAAKYDRSLGVLKYLASGGAVTKSGIMLGLGETEPEILETMDDLLETGCRIMTLGQYLQPSLNHMEIKEFITPEKFAEYKEIGLGKGFEFVESGPLVRTSYKAERHIKKAIIQ
jgi:lipoic acid synthetase